MSARILILESDPHICELYCEILGEEGEGHEVLIGYLPGYEPGHIIKIAPDLIILSYLFSHGGPGHLLLEQLQYSPATRHIPIIVATSHLEEAYKLQRQFGFEGLSYVIKPFDLEEFLIILRRTLQRVAGSAPPSQGMVLLS